MYVTCASEYWNCCLSICFACCSEEIGKSKFNSMIGLVDRERVDEALYDDYETDKAREVCLLLMLFLLLLFAFYS